PKSLRLQGYWNVLEAANKGLFCQLITVPLFKDHKILTQVAGHGSHTIKLLPPLTITEEDCGWIERAFDDVIAGSHKVPGAIWSLGKTLVDNAVRRAAQIGPSLSARGMWSEAKQSSIPLRMRAGLLRSASYPSTFAFIAASNLS